jgi:hypothetical protein
LKSPLLSRLDQLIGSSTAPSTVDVDLRHFLDLKLEAAAGRAEAAAAGSAQRSAEARAKIRAALGALPLDCPVDELARVVSKRLHGQDIGEWTIRDEIKKVQSERGLGTEASKKRV